jgi:hypothetical protein
MTSLRRTLGFHPTRLTFETLLRSTTNHSFRQAWKFDHAPRTQAGLTHQGLCADIPLMTRRQQNWMVVLMGKLVTQRVFGGAILRSVPAAWYWAAAIQWRAGDIRGQTSRPVIEALLRENHPQKRRMNRWQKFLDVWFSQHRWARRLIGGHWELWMIDIPGVGLVWHDVDVCSYLTERRPNPVCRGTPVCEDH